MVGADRHINNNIVEQKTVWRTDITVLIKTRSVLFSFVKQGSQTAKRSYSPSVKQEAMEKFKYFSFKKA